MTSDAGGIPMWGRSRTPAWVRLGLVLLAALGAAAGSWAANDPLELEPTDDTFLSAEHTGKPAGRGKKNEFQVYGAADYRLFRGLLKFDLRQAPPGFRAAILRLTCWNAQWKAKAEALLHCHALTRSWNEDGASWDQATTAGRWSHPGGDWQPLALSAARLSGPIGGVQNRTFDFDLTAAARQWQARPSRNYGVAVMFEKGCTAELRFRSREYNNAAERPKLLLYYRQAAPKGALMLRARKVPPLEPYDPAAPSIRVPSLPGLLKKGQPFTMRFSASGGKGPYLFGPAGRLPPGLRVQRDGTLKGTPSRAGAFVFGVACVGANGKRATNWFRWIVVDPAAAPPKAQAKRPAKPSSKSKQPARPAKPKKPKPGEEEEEE